MYARIQKCVKLSDLLLDCVFFLRFLKRFFFRIQNTPFIQTNFILTNNPFQSILKNKAQARNVDVDEP